MITFREFSGSEEEGPEKAMAVVRKGINLREDFWDDFLSLCGDAAGMAELLDVPREKITGLSGRIGRLKDKIKEKDSTGVKDRLITTGEMK
jgi:hypothetical protein